MTTAARPNIIAALIAGAASLLIGGIAVLSLWAALVALPAGEALEQIRQGDVVPRERRIMAAETSLRAGEIFERGRYFSDAALAASGLPPAERARALQGRPLKLVVDEALAAAPVSPHNWVRRASLQLAAGDTAGAAASIETSLLVGRYTPGLTVPRLKVMLLLLRRSPNASLRNAIEDQIRVAARRDPEDLARLVDGSPSEGLVQRVLFTDFELYGAYLKALIAARAERKAAADAAAAAR